MTRVYKSICMEIDDHTVTLMHLSEKLIHYKLEVEKLMNSGFVNIAKARYIMGSKCVSTLQLPTEHSNPVQALATVCRAPYGGYWAFKASVKKPSPMPSDEKLLKEKIQNDTTRPDVIKNLLEHDSKSLRKRKEFYVVEDNNYPELNDELQDEVSTISSESIEPQVTFTDPIRLFGVLVPFTLRTAQKNFQDVVHIIANCATIQSQIEAVLKKYHHLQNIKTMIESVAVERNIDLVEEKEYWSSEEYSEYSEILSVKSKTTTVATDESTIEEQEGKEVQSAIEMEIPGEEQFEFEGEADLLILPPDSSEMYHSEDSEEQDLPTSKSSTHH